MADYFLERKTKRPLWHLRLFGERRAVFQANVSVSDAKRTWHVKKKKKKSSTTILQHFVIFLKKKTDHQNNSQGLTAALGKHKGISRTQEAPPLDLAPPLVTS